jgi:hypothetical protein
LREVRAHAGVPGAWERVCVLGLLLILAAVLPLAHAAAPDPLWIHGIYDAGDADDAILLVASMERLVLQHPSLICPTSLVSRVLLTAGPALFVTLLRSLPARAPPKAPLAR